MKKIIFVITKANWGGAQRYVYDLATALPREEFETVVAFGKDGALAEKLRQSGIATYRSAFLERDVSVGKDMKGLVEMYRLFKRERPDIVHLNSSKAGGVGALAARLAGVPAVVFTAHGWPFLERRSIVARALIWLLSWLTSLLAHRTIVVSDHDLRVAQAMPFVGRKTVRIYNGLRPAQLASGDIIRAAFPAGTAITGTVGELTHNKNHIALIQEARRDPSLHVAIVGEGELRAMLEQKIREYGLEHRVKLFGFLPAEAVLKGFDRFALPSRKEGLPYALLEAKQAGLPTEANRVGGVGEILDKDMAEFSLERMLEKTFALYREQLRYRSRP